MPEESWPRAIWVEQLRSNRGEYAQVVSPAREWLAGRLEQRLQADYPVECDWLLQDGGEEALRRLLTGSEDAASETLTGLIQVPAAGIGGDEQPPGKAGPQAGNDTFELRLIRYAGMCEARRTERLRTVLQHSPRIVFTKRRTIRPSFFAYTEGQSDAQNERHFLPGSELCLLKLAPGTRAGEGVTVATETLLADPEGVIRDPAVSWEGDRVVFAWKKSLDGDDYHLYELTLATRAIRQITSGKGFADYEPAFLPNGDLIFASSRCVQTVDCWWTEVSNLYTCDRDGRFLRRLTFDQVHAIYPQVFDDGRVIYTRWDYNDRGQVFPQALFQMNWDGTGQMEFYGNNSWFPTTIAHARGIPGSREVLAIFCGHHTSQAGKLGVLDPAMGRQEAAGARLAAPLRPASAERIDAYGQEGELFQYPYPLNESESLVGYAPHGWDAPGGRPGDAAFGIYWMAMDGRRELLAWDPELACQQPVPLTARKRPATRPSLVDYGTKEGRLYVQDVYTGPGLAGVERGSIKRLRVVALDFRAAGVGNNYSRGPAGGALASTPISIGNGSWDVKMVLGEATVHPDGSAFFRVPARMPLYLQAVDAKGHAVQTMRSWTTLQPGETQSCVGCHEEKNSSPPPAVLSATAAQIAGAQALKPFHGPARGFSFAAEVQPILDRHCVSCHHDRGALAKRLGLDEKTFAEFVKRSGGSTESAEVLLHRPMGTFSLTGAAGREEGAPIPASDARISFSLLADGIVDAKAKRRWSDSYLALTSARLDDLPWDRAVWMGHYEAPLVNWIGAQSVPTMLPPMTAGSVRSGLMNLLADGHEAVRLSAREYETIACWIDLLVPYCGDYTEANAWTEVEAAKYERYLAKRQRMQAVEAANIQALMEARF